MSYSHRLKTAEMLRKLRKVADNSYLKRRKDVEHYVKCSNNQDILQVFVRGSGIIPSSFIKETLELGADIKVHEGDLYDEDGLWITAVKYSKQSDYQYWIDIRNKYNEHFDEDNIKILKNKLQEHSIYLTTEKLLLVKGILDEHN